MKGIIPVILCGGSGTRLWPLSRVDAPKQFLCLNGTESLFQSTIRRALHITDAAPSDVITVTLSTIMPQTLQHLRELDPALTRHVLSEPDSRNTAAAFALTAAYALREFGPDQHLLIFPCDHHVRNDDTLKEAVSRAFTAADDGMLVTFGTPPRRPETGYGYVAKGEALTGGKVYKASGFVEKPSPARAAELISSGYLWSMGVHLFRADAALRQYRLHAPLILSAAEQLLQHPRKIRSYKALKPEPFEKAVLEKTGNVAVAPCALEWSDIGSWDSLWSISPKDKDGNVMLEGGAGKILAHRTQNSILRAQDQLVACIGLENAVVIATGDAILVADKSCANSIKAVASTLQKIKAREALSSPRRDYGWGHSECLSDHTSMRTTKMTIYADGLAQLPAYRHNAVWVITGGEARISINHQEQTLKLRDTLHIPAGSICEIFNHGMTDFHFHEFLYRNDEEAELPATRMAAE